MNNGGILGVLFFVCGRSFWLFCFSIKSEMDIFSLLQLDIT